MATASKWRGSVHSSGACATKVVPVCNNTGNWCANGVSPERVEPLVLGQEAGVHRHQLDTPQAKLLMTDFQLCAANPLASDRLTGNRSTDRCLRHIVGHVAVIDPNAAQPSFAAENDRHNVARRRP